MDKYLYKDILVCTMKPFAEERLPEPNIFIWDNDPKHTARSNKTWFSSKNITFLNWPAQSPDLNSI